jgi:transcriptional regulator with XRE-family HTH domain
MTMAAPSGDYWSQALKAFRGRHGLSQAALGEQLGVDQTTVSRWERRLDQPGVRMRRRILDLTRQGQLSRQDEAVRMRVRNALWPATLLGQGAVFLEASRGAIDEARLSLPELRGTSIYGAFGPETDAVTEKWESAGIFRGDMALAISVNVLNPHLPGSETYIQTMDTPHFTADGQIWCVCEVKRIDQTQYRRLVTEYGGNTLLIPFEEV